jgi:MarR family transcriptional regulator for hemolysin
MTPAPADSAKESLQSLETAILAASRSVRRAYNARFARLDLNMTEAGLLLFIEDEASLTQRELADRLYIGRAATGGFIDGLQKRGLLRRLADPSDRRLWRISLTPEGSALAKECQRINAELKIDLRSGLDRDEYRTLIRLISNVRSNGDAIATSGSPSGDPQPSVSD